MMNVLPRPTLGEIRQAIRKRHPIRFIYQKQRWLVEPHLFGLARRTRAYVLSAWALEPEDGIRYFRFAEMRDFEVLFDRSFSGARPSFDPRDRKFVAVDTLIHVPY